MIQIMRFQDKSVISTPVVWFLISLFRKWSVEVKISKFTVTCPTLGHGSGEANSPIPVFLAPADCDSASVHCADWQHNKIHCQKHGWEQKIISFTEAETILHLIVESFCISHYAQLVQNCGRVIFLKICLISLACKIFFGSSQGILPWFGKRPRFPLFCTLSWGWGLAF